MRLISWNVNGLRAILGKNFKEIFRELNADIFCLQETKLSPGLVDVGFENYESFWNYADKKGYSGTATFSRQGAVRHTKGIGHDKHDREGRVITVEYDEFFLVNVYTPNSQNGLARLDYRIEWENAFLDYVTRLDARKPVIICGDLNVAHLEIDLANPKSNRRNPGFTDEERSALTRLLDAGFVDTFRHLNPDARRYSWWSYRYNARAKNIGWRIDYFLVSSRIAERIVEADILDRIEGSDHCPVLLVLSDTTP